MKNATKEDIDEFNKNLEKLQKNVVSNTKIVTPEDMGQDYMLHIAKKKFKELIPIFSHKAAESENNTLVRVHVAPHIRGCIVGYATALNDFEWSDINKKDSPWLGGYYIHKVNFKVALKPNQKMVFDAKDSDEVWLITYNKETVNYPAEIVGKLIPINTVHTRTKSGKRDIVVEFIMQLDEDLSVDNKRQSTKGFYRLKINQRTANIVEYYEIPKALYEQLKSAVGVTLLSYREPIFNSW